MLAYTRDGLVVLGDLVLELLRDILPADDAAKHHVLAVQVRRRRRRAARRQHASQQTWLHMKNCALLVSLPRFAMELRAWVAERHIVHAQQQRLVVLERERLVRKRSTVDRLAARAVSCSGVGLCHATRCASPW